MIELQIQLMEALRNAAKRLRDANILSDVVAQIDHFAEQVDQPCVVAVVGRVKAGKSTFVNALLGEDLAKVGVNETTATINCFRYGKPDALNPVRCYWNSGNITNESREFVDDLQGSEAATLARANDIDHLEYFLLSPYLQHVILVDTPGTKSAVEEHEKRITKFIGPGSKVDAIIYVVGVTASVPDKDFLEQFCEVTQNKSHALNSIGVMAKIDLNPEVMERREALAGKIAIQLRDNLNAVIPLSAGIHRILASLMQNNAAGLKQMMEVLRKVPPNVLKKLLSDSDLYLMYERDNCPVSVKEREELLGKMDWAVFTTIANIAANPSLQVSEVIGRLREITGFDQLNDILDRHFIRRSNFLHCYRIVNDALKLLNVVKYIYPEELARNSDKLNRFLNYIRYIQQVKNNPTIAAELVEFITRQLTPRVNPEELIDDLERALDEIKEKLEGYNDDFNALLQIEGNIGLFSEYERNELQALLGLRGLENEKRLPLDCISLSYIEERQRYWQQKERWGQNPVVCSVAQQALLRFGLIADEI